MTDEQHRMYFGIPTVNFNLAWAQFNEALPKIIAAMSKFAFSVGSIRAWRKANRKGRRGRVNRTRPRNYRARSKQ